MYVNVKLNVNSSEGRIRKYIISDSSHPSFCPKLTRSNTTSQVLQIKFHWMKKKLKYLQILFSYIKILEKSCLDGSGSIRANRMTWLRQIPERIYSRIGSRFRELTFKYVCIFKKLKMPGNLNECISYRFGDTKLVQKIFPAHFALEATIAEANEAIEDAFNGKYDQLFIFWRSMITLEVGLNSWSLLSCWKRYKTSIRCKETKNFMPFSQLTKWNF